MLAFNTSFKDSWEEPGYRIFEAFGERWLLQLKALTVQFEPWKCGLLNTVRYNCEHS